MLPGNSQPLFPLFCILNGNKSVSYSFYNHCDEGCRLTSKHGTVEFLTAMGCIENIWNPAAIYLKSVQVQGGILMCQHAGDIL